MLFYTNRLLVDAQPYRPCGKEFQVFHRLRDTDPAHSRGGYIDFDAPKGQHTRRKGLRYALLISSNELLARLPINEKFQWN